MDAKTAADKVNAGVDKLNDQELLAVYNALSGDATYKAELDKLMQAREQDVKRVLQAEQIQVNKNLTQAEQLSNVDVMDDKNKDFASTREYLNNMKVVDENGKEVNVASDIIEIAKLQTIADLSQKSKPFTQTEYNSCLKDHIDLSICDILATEKLVTAPNSQPTMTDVTKAIDSILSGKKQTVSHVSASAVLGNKMADLKGDMDGLGQKFGKLDVMSRLKGRMEKVNQNLTSKLKQTYVKARAYAQMLNEQGVWADVGMAAVAGIGGPVGVAAYGAWTFYRRAWPMVEAYKEEKKTNPEMKNFWQYAKTHKKDAVMAGLYTVSAVASVGIGVAGVVQGISNGAAATAAIAPLTQAKMYTAAATIAVRGGTDIWAAETPEDRKKAVKRAIFYLGAFALGRAGAEAASNYFNAPTVDGGVENVDATPTVSTDSAAVAPVDTATVETPATDANAAIATEAAEVELPTQWNKDMGISPKQFNTLFNHPETQFIGGEDALETAYGAASRLSADQLSALGVKSPEELVYKFSRLEFQLGVDKGGNLLVGNYAVDGAHPELGNFADNKLKLEKLLNCEEIIQEGGLVQPSDLAGMKALLGHIDETGRYHGIGDHVITTNRPNGGTLNDCDKVNIPHHRGGGRVPTPVKDVDTTPKDDVKPEPVQEERRKITPLPVEPERIPVEVNVVPPAQLEVPNLPNNPVVETQEEPKNDVVKMKTSNGGNSKALQDETGKSDKGKIGFMPGVGVVRVKSSLEM